MTMVKWDDVKDDYARKDAEIELLKEEVESLRGYEKSIWALDAMEKLNSLNAKEFEEYLSQCVKDF